ncbi:MAG: hypothetical protein IKN64_02695 [Desulfovibrio sp.]|nr:hypothetical protein [Desulfovibrio sp.]
MKASQTPSTKEKFASLLQYAPFEIKKAILALLPAAKRALDAGYQPMIHNSVLNNWRCLLSFLSSLASMQAEHEMLLRTSSDLLSIADHMAPPEEVLTQSARILVRALHADLFVCRLRSNRGEWKVRYADATSCDHLPIVAPMLEESLRQHPVMRAILEGHSRYIVSNNLQSIEKGGESFDCMIYKEGYRSRLAFVLRERGNRPPFGLVMLYTRREYGFDGFDEHFLAKFAKIVSLTVGRRVAVTRDTLQKAAGAMAHYGNNVLNIMQNSADYCRELIEIINEDHAEALGLASKLTAMLPQGSHEAKTAQHLAELLKSDEMAELTDLLKDLKNETSRMEHIISSLGDSVDRPRLLNYVAGYNVLRLEDS